MLRLWLTLGSLQNSILKGAINAHPDESPFGVVAIRQHPQQQRLHICHGDGSAPLRELHLWACLHAGQRRLPRQRPPSTSSIVHGEAWYAGFAGMHDEPRCVA